jgi:transposase
MLTLAAGTRIYLALAPVDMRPSRPAGRARFADRIIRPLADDGFDGLAAQVQQALRRDPFGGQLFLFHSRRGDRLKALWWDGTGHPRAYAAFGHGPSDLFAKRLEHGRFAWPSVKEGAIVLTSAQLAMLIEGLDWRRAVQLTEVARPTAV